MSGRWRWARANRVPLVAIPDANTGMPEHPRLTPLPVWRSLHGPASRSVHASLDSCGSVSSVRMAVAKRDPFRLPTFATDLAARFCIHVPPVRAA